MRDGKRFAILALLVIYATGLSIAIGMRNPVLVRVIPNRITLYTVAPDGSIHNHFRILASNRSHTDAKLSLSLTGLPSASIMGIDQAVALKPGETLQREFDIASLPARLAPGINHVQIVATVTPAGKAQSFDETFFAPTDTNAKRREHGSSAP